MSIAGIDTVAVVVADGMKALAWYREVLGLEVAYVPPGGGHWIELGSVRPRTRIHLCELPDQLEPGPTGITFYTRDVPAEYENLRSRGVKFLGPPDRKPWGEWLCAFVDPDGNEFDLKGPIDAGAWKD